ncbi:MAG TPA: NADH-quinone oxidoreductase subunit J [Noviherbaspirillum sp.]|nr:NADH-quinone oxidoreductase subunit J [Noviherbaspirillum sp.]
MELKTALFFAFAAVLVFAALRVVTDRNPVHAALYLVLSFFSAAALWLLLKAEFLAIVLVLVYVGAVMVLFLFVVMMVDIDLAEIRSGFMRYLPLAALVGILIVLQMGAVLWHGFYATEADVPEASAYIGTTAELGRVLYTDYIYAFEIAGILLLVALVAAAGLTLRRRKDTRYFDPGEAVKVKRADRIRLVKMKAESERTNANEEANASTTEKQ